MTAHRLLALAVLLLPVSATAQLAGDRWEARRGDLTPNLVYNAVAQTPTGRLIAVGDSGALMVSDDAGTSWRFRQMETATGGVLRASLSDIVAFTASGTTRVVAIATTLEGGGASEPPFVGRTYTYQSTDDGETWTEHPFPFASAVRFGRAYHGVSLTGLHVTPTNLLLAFGTTSVSDNGLFVWSTGGLIYRSSDGAAWELANFSHGPVYQIAKAGARLVAAGVSSVFDSADGAGWNGYLLRDADLDFPDGGALSLAEKDRVDLWDVAVEGDGTYVMRASIDTTDGDTRQFVMRASAPFGPGREWIMEEQTTFFGSLLTSSSGLLGFASQLFRTLDHGASWSVFDADVAMFTGSVVRTSPSDIVAVTSANRVWKSTTDGTAWSKVWDKSVGPNLRPTATVDGTVYAFAGDDNLWASDTNGDTWELRATNVTGSSLVGRNGRLIRPRGAEHVWTSDDRGFTWEERDTGGPFDTFATIIEANAGRLLLAADGKDFSNLGKFFVSDDDGTTWEPRTVDGLRFGDEIKAAARLASGRLIAGTNEFAGFEPLVFVSDDNGDSWSSFDNIRFLPGLDPISNVPGEHVLEIQQLAASPSGRVLMRGPDELLTSDDGGATWTIRFNGNLTNVAGSPLLGQMFDLERMGTRWIALGFRRDPQNRPVHFALISDDDGTTWRDTTFRLNQTNTFLQSLTAGREGRLIAGGSNGAIYVSDGIAPPPEPTSVTQQVREATGIQVVVPRPPIPGDVEATYTAVPDTATADDYAPTSGVLTWTENETDPKSFALNTVDDAAKEADERIRVRLSFRNDDVSGTSEIVVVVRDDDGGTDAAIQVDGAAFLYTSEMGDAATVRVALNRAPTANVVLAVDNVDATEGTVLPGTLTFTPQNWNVQQELVVTGLDDAEPDGHVSYTFRLTPTSTDAAYDALPKTLVSVVNVDDEPPTGTTLPPSTVTTTTATTTTIAGATTTLAATTSTTTLLAVTSTTVPVATTTTTTLPPCTTARCVLDDALRTGPCADEQPPAAITKKLDQSAAAITALPDQTPKKAKATRKKAKRLLKAAGRAAVKASKGKKPKLTADCARAISAAATQISGGL